jgi:hypothetical protein
MKKILTKFLALSSVALLMLSACKKDGNLVTSNGGKAGALTASTTTPVLDKTKLTDPTAVITFSFTQASYGFTAAVTNTLQIDAAGDNWAKPTSVTMGTKVYTQGYSTGDFNALLLKLNLPAGVASQVNVRIVHTISATVAPVYSNVLSLTVTPFNLTSYLWITGSFSGWGNPGTPPTIDSLVSVTGNGVYTGIINFTAGNRDFLILPKKGDWSHKYATNDPKNTTSSTVTYDAPNNLYAPSTAGWYWITFNLNTGSISFLPANYYSIIGDAALGWGTDVPMKFVNDGNNNWVATLSLASTGSFKVRQNNDWTYSWGIPKPGSEGDGVAATLNDTSNNNISVSATGTHTVAFSIPITSVGTKPSVTATYSVTP